MQCARLHTGTTPHFQSLSEWAIDATTGAWSVASGNNYVLNPTFEAESGCRDSACWLDHQQWEQRLGRTHRELVLATHGHLEPRSDYPKPAERDVHAFRLGQEGAAGGQLYAKGFGGTDKSTSIGSESAWTNLSITGIAVTNGQCDVGVTTSGQTVTVDDFTLTGN